MFHTSKTVHRLLVLGIGLMMTVAFVLAIGAWRLSQGPIALGWLADRVKTALIDPASPVHVSFEGLALAWEGFHRGVDYPLDLRVSNIAVTDAKGRSFISAPEAHLTLSLAGLILGRIVPRAIEIDDARIHLTMAADGSLEVPWRLTGGSSSAVDGRVGVMGLLGQLSRPIASDYNWRAGWLDQIRRAHLHDAAVTLRDPASGWILRTGNLNLSVLRAASGGLDGTLSVPLQAGKAESLMVTNVHLAANGRGTVTAKLSPFTPAAMGPLPAILAGLGAVDLPIAVRAQVGFNTALKGFDSTTELRLGSGMVRIGQGVTQLMSGLVVIKGTQDDLSITTGHLQFGVAADGTPETADITGRVTQAAGRIVAALKVGADGIDLADLPRFWPEGVANDPRHWVMQHVSAGMVTHGSVSFVLETDGAFHDAALTQASGELEATNGVFTWLDHMPVVDQTHVRLHLVDPDTLDIHVLGGRQEITGGGPPLVIKDGRMRITGLTYHDQLGAIHVQVEGSVLSALALLKEPRLHMLSDHPLGLKAGAGHASAALSFEFPLKKNLLLDDVQIHADARLSRLRLIDVVDGRDLDDGAFDLLADKDGLTLQGNGSLASVPLSVNGKMDFNSGPPQEIVQTITAQAQPDAAQLSKAGVGVRDYLSGPISMTAVLTERRNGTGSLRLSGDLTRAALRFAPLGWRKAPGVRASFGATLAMVHDRLAGIDPIFLRGEGLSLAGVASVAGGRVQAIRLDEARLGQTRGSGMIRVAQDGRLAIALQGGQIDLAPKLMEKGSGTDRPPPPPAMVPPWTLEAHFDKALLAHGETAGHFVAHITALGEAVVSFDASGALVGGGRFAMRIAPRGTERHLSVEASDAGRFLRGIDAVRTMQGGQLRVDGSLSSPYGLYPMAGLATIDGVVVRDSPVLGKLLQAITLYGLVDALRGPGMAFDQVVVPFRYDGAYLSLEDARASNPSLGVTARGRIGLGSARAAINGTIVPAYFFNALLGRLPFVGKLFSPEKGGGVFAANFSLDGPLDDPNVTVNPISALTPGFLREIFGLFGKSGMQTPAN